MKFSLCLEPVFPEVEIYERVQFAKECGLDAIELWDPSVYDAKKLAKAAQKYDLPVAVCGVCDSWTYRLNSPYEAVKKSIEKTIQYGKDLGCSTFIGLSGELECKVDSQKSILIENLKRLSEFCEKQNVIVLLEALNSLYDHKGYYLDSSYVGFEIIKSVNSPAIKLLYDCYHMQIMEGNLINSIKTNIDFIGHFHSAGVPGRHELHLGETNYPYVIKAAEEAGYGHYFGFEYWPTYEGRKSLMDIMAYVRS
jgi:hydroxypyruvate isomerase